jgi:two-component system OmpR family response regulator
MKANPIQIYLVDDDALFLKSLEIDFIHQGKYKIKTFATGEECIRHLSTDCNFVILDYHLDGIDIHAMNGIDTLDKIKEYNYNIPVIMLSSQDKIEVAIDCMHHKASDYVVKSETAFFRLNSIIESIIQQNIIEGQLNWYMNNL